MYINNVCLKRCLKTNHSSGLPEEESIKSQKSFRDYYQDPEFKERHKQNIMQKVRCECGTITSKCILSHHRKTKKHRDWEESQNNDKEEIIRQLKKEIKKMNRLIDSLSNQ